MQSLCIKGFCELRNFSVSFACIGVFTCSGLVGYSTCLELNCL